MTQASLQFPSGGSRLVRCLAELAAPELATSDRHFDRRLAQRLDLADSINLANALDKLPAASCEPATISPEDIGNEFLAVRAALVESVISSFTLGSGAARIALPTTAVPAGSDPIVAFEPYLKFYQAHQRQMDYKIQLLHTQSREAAAAQSVSLARLVVLDEALEDTLSLLARKSLALLPRVLGRRFAQLLPAKAADEDLPETALADRPAALQRFYADMQELLLAEIEARLLPVWGLVEAINANNEPGLETDTP